MTKGQTCAQLVSGVQPYVPPRVFWFVLLWRSPRHKGTRLERKGLTTTNVLGKLPAAQTVTSQFGTCCMVSWAWKPNSSLLTNKERNPTVQCSWLKPKQIWKYILWFWESIFDGRAGSLSMLITCTCFSHSGDSTKIELMTHKSQFKCKIRHE